MTNKEIVTQINDAFTKGDVEGFLNHCTEDLVWNMFGDTRNEGKENIRKWMNSNEGNCEPPVFSVDNLFGEGDLVACDGDMTMKTAEGKEWKGRYCDLYRFDNGKVKELRSYVIENKN